MRIDQAEPSTLQRGKSWGPAADAPTHLPSDELVVRASSDSIITSAPRKQRARRPSQSTLKQPLIAFEGGASFDPLAIPLPPELAPPLYGWLRRLALQADL